MKKIVVMLMMMVMGLGLMSIPAHATTSDFFLQAMQNDSEASTSTSVTWNEAVKSTADHSISMTAYYIIGDPNLNVIYTSGNVNFTLPTSGSSYLLTGSWTPPSGTANGSGYLIGYSITDNTDSITGHNQGPFSVVSAIDDNDGTVETSPASSGMSPDSIGPYCSYQSVKPYESNYPYIISRGSVWCWYNLPGYPVYVDHYISADIDTMYGPYHHNDLNHLHQWTTEFFSCSSCAQLPVGAPNDNVTNQSAGITGECHDYWSYDQFVFYRTDNVTKVTTNWILSPALSRCL